MAVGKVGKGRNSRARRRASRKAGRRDTKRMTELKPKPTTDTLRGGFKPSWEEEE